MALSLEADDENKDVIFFSSKFPDPKNSTHGFQVKIPGGGKVLMAAAAEPQLQRNTNLWKPPWSWVFSSRAGSRCKSDHFSGGLFGHTSKKLKHVHLLLCSNSVSRSLS